MRALRTWHGTKEWCPQCHGHWVSQPKVETPSPLMARVLDRLWENASAGRCSLGLHEVPPRAEQCAQCPESSHRCPSCAARLTPTEVSQQRVEVCTHCFGVWLETNGLVALHRGPLPKPFALALGLGKSIGVHRYAPRRPERVILALVLVDVLAVLSSWFYSHFHWLFLALGRLLHGWMQRL